MRISVRIGSVILLLASLRPVTGYAGLAESGSACSSLFSSTISDDEIRSIKAYIYLGFQNMNSKLRNPVLSVFRSPEVELLKLAVSKLPVRKGVVYRGAYLSKRALSRYRVGKRYVERAFLSTSTEALIIDLYSNPLIVPKMFRSNGAIAVAFIIQSLTGREIDNERFGGTEHEVIFPPKTTFLVTGIERTEAGYTVSMSEERKQSEP